MPRMRNTQRRREMCSHGETRGSSQTCAEGRGGGRELATHELAILPPHHLRDEDDVGDNEAPLLLFCRFFLSSSSLSACRRCDCRRDGQSRRYRQRLRHAAHSAASARISILTATCSWHSFWSLSASAHIFFLLRAFLPACRALHATWVFVCLRPCVSCLLFLRVPSALLATHPSPQARVRR